MTLKNVLLINAISSGITGLLLVLIPDTFASLFKTDKLTPFTAVGIFLILFSLVVLINALQKPIKKSLTQLIIGLDLTWVLASIITTMFLFSSISHIGSIIILAIASWVGLMAYLQKKFINTI
ncbi:hypothetical protein [Sphingobacterium cellulitidis]|uniref:hypothetical protein n=1 Tax=Sphingobacterium cellulitidis TaxID=1768011 RepID=UPI00146B6BEF